MKRKPEVMNSLFIDFRTTLQDLVNLIKVFREEGYVVRYDKKTKVLKTTAPKTKIKELSKEFPSIQSYDYSVIDRNPINHNNATDRNLIKEQK